jgi:signal transduction histidine kinase
LRGKIGFVRANSEASSEPVEGYFSLRGGEFTDAGSCATEIKSALAGLGVSQEIIIHAIAGTLSYEVRGGDLAITVRDMGPGIPDIEQAMKEGYTTAPEWAREKGWGSGLGLPNIEKNCDNLRVDTVLGEGTTLEITLHLDRGGEEGGTAE